MKDFYFSFGVGTTQDTGQPYQGGHSVVKADSLEQAIEKFNHRHPLSKNGLVNCAFWYTQEQWELNRGKFESICHEVIQ